MNPLIKSFACAIQGLLLVIKTEKNFKIHLIVALGVIVLGLYMELTLWKWAVLILTIAQVLISEILNTALEGCVDLFSLKYHPAAKRAKDIAAGAVLLSAITAVIMGVVIFIL